MLALRAVMRPPPCDQDAAYRCPALAARLSCAQIYPMLKLKESPHPIRINVI